ncbi:Alpha/Beta hydrolase protein [Chytridium lagenaria]|nr:Alpha/Beta hydrolase protein [Chytridium lagenaria]
MPLTITENDAIAACKTLQSAASLSTARFLGPSSVDPPPSLPFPVLTAVLNVSSADGRFRAIIKKSNPEKPGDAATEHLEIIRPDGLPALLIPIADVAGDAVKSGSLLSGAAFNSDGTYFAFAANRKKPKSLAFTKKPSTSSGPNATERPRGEEYDHETQWGEGLAVVQSIIVLVDLVKGTASEVSALGDSHTWAQVEWHPTDPGLFLVVGYPNEDHRQGLLHFNTRRSHLYQVEVGTSAASEGDKGVVVTSKAKPVNLDFEAHNVLWPRFSPDGSKLVFLTTDDVLFHVSCSKLALVKWNTAEKKAMSSSIIVDKVVSPDGLDAFTGLWPRAIVQPRSIWIGNDHVIFASQERAKYVLLVISISGKVHRFKGPELAGFEGGSLDLLDLQDGRLLVRLESPLSPPTVILSKVVVTGEAVAIKWPSSPTLVVSPAPIPQETLKFLSSSTACVITVNQEVDVIVLLPPKVTSSTRLILQPHGGPHGAFATTFSPLNNYFLSLGFALALVNFRGSSGYGQHCIEVLPGHCGEYDVEDCMLASKATYAAFPTLEPSQQVVMGGSHGGFLTLWLIAKFPDAFRSAVSRNPVANIAHMMSITDIPDWCAVECGISWDITGVPSAEDYKTMYAMSPISQIHKVKTPLMLCLGDADKRVPMSQSLDYFRVLKRRGVKSRCLVFPGNSHSLNDRVDTELNHWVNMALWLAEN